MGFTRSGLPIGMQIVGARFDEATVLRIGRAYEAETDFAARRPPLDDGSARRTQDAAAARSVRT